MGDLTEFYEEWKKEALKNPVQILFLGWKRPKEEKNYIYYTRENALWGNNTLPGILFCILRIINNEFKDCNSREEYLEKFVKRYFLIDIKDGGIKEIREFYSYRKDYKTRDTSSPIKIQRESPKRN